MNGLALLGIFLVAYAIALAGIALKKPEKIWNMAKVRMFRKILGETGTVIFFYAFALISLGFGIWLLTL